MPWREVLHDGPVPALPPDELRGVRGRFLGDETLLRERDERLAAALGKGEPVMLWFEADLYDVLLLHSSTGRASPRWSRAGWPRLGATRRR